MKFKQFLNEAISDGKYKMEIDIEKAASIYLEECSKINIDKPLWRGMRDKQPSFILRGNSGKRASLSIANAHNVILDEDISNHRNKYPLRSECIIASTNGAKDYSKRFGDECYAIYPYNKSIIGLCQQKDILEREYEGLRITDINELILEITGIRGEYSLSELVKHIYDVIESGDTDCDDEDYLKLFGKFFENKSRGEIEEKLLDIYGLENYDFVYNDSSKLSGSKEVWIGNNCLAIHEKYLEEFKKLVKDSK